MLADIWFAAGSANLQEDKPPVWVAVDVKVTQTNIFQTKMQAVSRKPIEIPIGPVAIRRSARKASKELETLSGNHKVMEVPAPIQKAKKTPDSAQVCNEKGKRKLITPSAKVPASTSGSKTTLKPPKPNAKQIKQKGKKGLTVLPQDLGQFEGDEVIKAIPSRPLARGKATQQDQEKLANSMPSWRHFIKDIPNSPQNLPRSRRRKLDETLEADSDVDYNYSKGTESVRSSSTQLWSPLPEHLRFASRSSLDTVTGRMDGLNVTVNDLTLFPIQFPATNTNNVTPLPRGNDYPCPKVIPNAGIEVGAELLLNNAEIPDATEPGIQPETPIINALHGTHEIQYGPTGSPRSPSGFQPPMVAPSPRPTISSLFPLNTGHAPERPWEIMSSKGQNSYFGAERSELGIDQDLISDRSFMTTQDATSPVESDAIQHRDIRRVQSQANNEVIMVSQPAIVAQLTWPSILNTSEGTRWSISKMYFAT
ncbi:hypothetical protein CPB86DRAFT_820454 [Serendipita vermifera]|nr:hypothetical protein CPB86DRAFT_820454 [Serendipita vermifera]